MANNEDVKYALAVAYKILIDYPKNINKSKEELFKESLYDLLFKKEFGRDGINKENVILDINKEKMTGEIIYFDNTSEWYSIPFILSNALMKELYPDLYKLETINKFGPQKQVKEDDWEYEENDYEDELE